MYIYKIMYIYMIIFIVIYIALVLGRIRPVTNHLACPQAFLTLSMSV